MGLTSLVRRMKGASVEDLLNKIGLWEAREVARLEMLLVGSTDQRQRTVESKIEAIRDQASMLISLADGADSVNHVEDRIDALFKDDGMGIAGMVTCSSVHKAKGLEADRVFVLQDTMKHHNQEELNIQYVAITRAKHELVYVVDDRKETR
jgi:superfamily I DNA/RNA helicase